MYLVWVAVHRTKQSWGWAQGVAASWTSKSSWHRRAGRNGASFSWVLLFSSCDSTSVLHSFSISSISQEQFTCLVTTCGILYLGSTAISEVYIFFKIICFRESKHTWAGRGAEEERTPSRLPAERSPPCLVAGLDLDPEIMTQAKKQESVAQLTEPPRHRFWSSLVHSLFFRQPWRMNLMVASVCHWPLLSGTRLSPVLWTFPTGAIPTCHVNFVAVKVR